MTLIRSVLCSLRLIAQQQRLINAQQRLIEDQQRELRTLQLRALREMHGLVSAWRIHTETPELDLRDDLTALATTLSHQAARLEEHVI
jgi:hypothetical protein